MISLTAITWAKPLPASVTAPDTSHVQHGQTIAELPVMVLSCAQRSKGQRSTAQGALGDTISRHVDRNRLRLCGSSATISTGPSAIGWIVPRPKVDILSRVQ